MKKDNFSEKFLDLLKDRFPQKGLLVNELANLLPIEKESIYRRLRGEVAFTLDETGYIAEKFGISLDSIMGNTQGQYSPSPCANHSVKTREETNFDILVNYVDKIKEISKKPNSEHAQALNYIPLGLCLPYSHLVRFIVYQFLHLYEDNGIIRPFCDYKISSRIQDELFKMDYYLKKISFTYYIWDPSIFTNMVNNIHYFTSIQLITPEETAALKKELFRYLDDLERYAFNGKFSQTDTRFALYISGVHINFTHAYLHADSVYMSIFMTFILQTVTSFEKETCMELMSRIHSLRKLSTLISMVAEKERIDFFRGQREIVESL